MRERLVQVTEGTIPPYSAGQRSAEDNNANENYPSLDSRIESTYAKSAGKSTKSGLYDSYIRAFRWASDRIGSEGAVCFVSNANWLRNKSFDGFRKSITEEYNSIYVLDLRGNQRTQGEESRKEGGKVFGSGSRAPIAITLLVKNQQSNEHGVVRYVDVGDYKTQREKLDFTADAAITEPSWTILAPDEYGDWLEHRDSTFGEMIPLGLEKSRDEAGALGLFRTYSAGVVTNRDDWAYSFGEATLHHNVDSSVAFYNSELDRYLQNGSGIDSKEFVSINPRSIKWDASLFKSVQRGQRITVSDSGFEPVYYRPFTRVHGYVDKALVWSQYRQANMFLGEKENIAIAVVGTGTTKQFSALMTDCLPDRQLMGNMQCYPLYVYEEDNGDTLFSISGSKSFRDKNGKCYIRRYAITDKALAVFQAAYPCAYADRAKSKGGTGLSVEDVFYYVYGILHSPVYCERFAANLTKELPRIPLVRDFESFADAGRQLAHLHLHYEELEPWPTVSVDMLRTSDLGPVKKIAWAKKKDPETGKRVPDYTKLVYNANLTITGIPEEAQNYVVNGRSPLDWVIDRYQVKTDKKSGITNDPNDYSDDPWYIVDLIVRLVRVSMETQQIVQSLPTNIDEIPHPDNWPVEWSVQA